MGCGVWRRIGCVLVRVGPVCVDVGLQAGVEGVEGCCLVVKRACSGHCRRFVMQRMRISEGSAGDKQVMHTSEAGVHGLADWLSLLFVACGCCAVCLQPAILFVGDKFEADADFKLAKSMLLDMFRGKQVRQQRQIWSHGTQQQEQTGSVGVQQWVTGSGLMGCGMPPVSASPASHWLHPCCRHPFLLQAHVKSQCITTGCPALCARDLTGCEPAQIQLCAVVCYGVLWCAGGEREPCWPGPCAGGICSRLQRPQPVAQAVPHCLQEERDKGEQLRVPDKVQGACCILSLVFPS